MASLPSLSQLRIVCPERRPSPPSPLRTANCLTADGVKQHSSTCFYYAARTFVSCIVEALELNGANLKQSLSSTMRHWLYDRLTNDRGEDTGCLSPPEEMWTLYTDFLVADNVTLEFPKRGEPLPKNYFRFLPDAVNALGLATRESILRKLRERQTLEYWEKLHNFLVSEMSDDGVILYTDGDTGEKSWIDMSRVHTVADLFSASQPREWVNALTDATEGGSESLLALAALVLIPEIDLAIRTLSTHDIEEGRAWCAAFPEGREPLQRNGVLMQEFRWKRQGVELMACHVDHAQNWNANSPTEYARYLKIENNIDISHLLCKQISLQQRVFEDRGVRRFMMATLVAFGLEGGESHSVVILPCTKEVAGRRRLPPQFKVVDSVHGKSFPSMKDYFEEEMRAEKQNEKRWLSPPDPFFLRWRELVVIETTAVWFDQVEERGWGNV